MNQSVYCDYYIFGDSVLYLNFKIEITNDTDTIANSILSFHLIKTKSLFLYFVNIGVNSSFPSFVGGPLEVDLSEQPILISNDYQTERSYLLKSCELKNKAYLAGFEILANNSGKIYISMSDPIFYSKLLN